MHIFSKPLQDSDNSLSRRRQNLSSLPQSNSSLRRICSCLEREWRRFGAVALTLTFCRKPEQVYWRHGKVWRRHEKVFWRHTFISLYFILYSLYYIVYIYYIYIYIYVSNIIYYFSYDHTSIWTIWAYGIWSYGHLIKRKGTPRRRAGEVGG